MLFLTHDKNFQKLKINLKYFSILLNLDTKLNGFQKDSEEVGKYIDVNTDTEHTENNFKAKLYFLGFFL